MKDLEALPSDLIIEPLKLKHLSMLRDKNNSKLANLSLFDFNQDLYA